MNKETLKRIFDFLEEKGEHRGPLFWKHKYNIPLTKEDLNVKGDLNLAYSKITSLPKGLKVGGDLRLDGCANITSLPKGLVVDGDLNVSGTPLEDVYDENQMYDELIEPGFIRGAVIFSWPNPDDEDYEADEYYDDNYDD